MAKFSLFNCLSFNVKITINSRNYMGLEKREKAIALIANGVSVYSMYTERSLLPENLSMIDFVLKSVPKDVKPEITIELVDEVFNYVSKAHLELS